MSLEEENLETTVSIITKLGLTNLQAKAYLGLVQLGGGSASEAAKAANINRAEIYRIMRELQKHGIVEYSISAPKKFIPIPPEKAVNRLIEKMKTQIHEIENEKNNLINRLNSTKAKISEKETPTFYTIIENRKQMHEKAWGLIKNAKSNLSIIMRSRSPLIRIIDLGKMLNRVARRVKTKLIMEVTPENLAEIEKYDKSIEIKHKEENTLLMIIADNKDAGIGFYYSEKFRDNTKVNSFWSNDKNLIEVFITKYFDFLWSDSVPLKDRIQQFKKCGKAPQ